MKTALLFPGQGSQYVGMGRSWIESVPSCRSVFEAASESIDLDLQQLIWHGDEAQLRQTAVAQPAIVAVSLALLERVYELGFVIDCVGGHSVGEISSLVAADALEMADAMRLVKRRGELMEAAQPAGRGGMIAVIGADRSELEEIVNAYSGLGIAAVNAPGQIVLGGLQDQLEQLMPVLRAKRWRMVKLNVSGPFHTHWMASAAEKWARDVARFTFQPPQCPYACNVTGRLETDVAQIGARLVAQVSSTLQWENCIRSMLAVGVTRFIDVGPGHTLTGHVKRIAPAVETITLDEIPGAGLQAVD